MIQAYSNNIILSSYLLIDHLSKYTSYREKERKREREKKRKREREKKGKRERKGTWEKERKTEKRESSYQVTPFSLSRKIGGSR